MCCRAAHGMPMQKGLTTMRCAVSVHRSLGCLGLLLLHTLELQLVWCGPTMGVQTVALVLQAYMVAVVSRSHWLVTSTWLTQPLCGSVLLHTLYGCVTHGPGPWHDQQLLKTADSKSRGSVFLPNTHLIAHLEQLQCTSVKLTSKACRQAQIFTARCSMAVKPWPPLRHINNSVDARHGHIAQHCWTADIREEKAAG